MNIYIYIYPLVCLFSGRSGGGGGQLGSRCNFFMTLKRYVLNAKRICTRLGSRAVLSKRNETKRIRCYITRFSGNIFFISLRLSSPRTWQPQFYSLPLSGITFPPHYKFLFVDGTGWRKSTIVCWFSTLTQRLVLLKSLDKYSFESHHFLFVFVENWSRRSREARL